MGQKRDLKEFAQASVIRAVHTAAQTALGMLAYGMAIQDVNWLQLLSVSAMAALISILKSIVAGLPETRIDGEFILDDTNPDTTKWTLKYDGDPDLLTPGDSVRFHVVSFDEVSKGDDNAGLA